MAPVCNGTGAAASVSVCSLLATNCHQPLQLLSQLSQLLWKSWFCGVLPKMLFFLGRKRAVEGLGVAMSTSVDRTTGDKAINMACAMLKRQSDLIRF
ncbi:hypothetical protein CFC21_079051 [Triticum aestivum]|uniref:Uncharacterized protein n=4 Tax=Triticum TaxID=4564 RepID=A0A341W5M5_WHEAT|nr:hypothetical protein TRIUR3_00057 [Triticum urartu]KAF7060452.1 hypothetical protein CFC21_067240 [Triticum aestivum]KAF7067162.1 hypothetical protein CFC21_073080 [Triticum aestivum]KAF7074141.1 hypothetical protein CFC21_079051 [Triticum aestivum]VAI20773.1 unnamed protein product [Triticum turgidum subsp. durum]